MIVKMFIVNESIWLEEQEYFLLAVFFVFRVI